MNKEIIVYSVPRSAGTLITKLVKEITKNKVRDSHSFELGNDFVILSIRDFRDCVVSSFQKVTGKNTQMGFLDIIYFSKMILRYAYILDKYLESDTKVLVLKYERFVNDFDYIFDRCEDFFNITIALTERKRLKKEYNLKASKKNLSFEVKDGKTNKWKDVIPHKYYSLIYFILRNRLLRYGYSRSGIR